MIAADVLGVLCGASTDAAALRLRHVKPPIAASTVAMSSGELPSKSRSYRGATVVAVAVSVVLLYVVVYWMSLTVPS